MRDDAIMIFVSGQDFTDTNNTFQEFESSPLAKVRDTFIAKYPDVPVACLTWHNPLILPSFTVKKKTVVLGHSFGGQRVLHSIQAQKDSPESMDIILCDPVRYSFSDSTDPYTQIDSTIFAQKFNRNPLPVPMEVESCQAFLREGGQMVWSFPQSSPITEDNATRKNVYVPGVDHVSIIFSDMVQTALWKLCDEKFSVNA